MLIKIKIGKDKLQFVFSKDACIKTCIYFAVMYVGSKNIIKEDA